jgi:TolA-binding protein
MKKHCIYLGLILFTVSCTTGNLRVESQPEGAEVYVAINGQTSRKIGVTPLSVPESQINSGNESFQISILKEGYAPEHILAPATTFASSSNVQVKLKEQLNAKQAVNDEVLQKISSQIAYSIELIKNKEYDSAERSLLNLQTQFPNVATIHELLGNVFYLRKDLSKAHGYYRRAAILNPNNLDTTRMIQKIEGIRSDLRSPSSAGGY